MNIATIFISFSLPLPSFDICDCFELPTAGSIRNTCRSNHHRIKQNDIDVINEKYIENLCIRYMNEMNPIVVN